MENLFHPHVQAWFNQYFEKPTIAEEMAWPVIARGEHVLVVAPTGSGKTLTAFLVAIDRLIRNTWKPGATRVLYVSPLRALNNDIHRNLEIPLQGIAEVFAKAGEAMPTIRTATRSGDTEEAKRREMLRKPPEILITTPESLNILLTSKGGVGMLGDLKTVILDEIHAVAGSKRGTHLITAVERLQRLSGEFQRIALSATVRPAKRVAKWVGGYRISGQGCNVTYEPRDVKVINAGQKKDFSLAVHFRPPEEENDRAIKDGGNPVWETIAKSVRKNIEDNNSTLVFGNSRKTVEKLARLINGDSNEKKVWAHHGSLSREIREVVEERLKKGQLSGIVATNSLELGIDIGAIDEVIMVESPLSVASTIQRLGRSGHGVGETSRGRIYAPYSRDLINAAVNVEGVKSGETEPIFLPLGPLDVLAQVILSMTARETWKMGELLDFLRTMEPYHTLSATHFQLIIDMLAGKYAGARIDALKPRVRVDRVSETVTAKPGTDRLIYVAGGTIPDRGYFTLRTADNRSIIGQLDEEFVWERSIGDTFALGVQTWRIQGISHNDVFVAPGGSKRAPTPFWTSEERASKFWFAERKGRFLKRANGELEKAAFLSSLKTDYFFDDDAAFELIRFLRSQRTHTGCDLPHRHHVVVEHVNYPETAGPKNLTVIHTTWGGRVNRPFALALAQEIENRQGKNVPFMVDEDCVTLELPEFLPARDIFGLIRPEDVERLVRHRLENGGLFGAHFREAAGRSLLLPRAGFKRRTPLWLSRKRAKDLKQAVSKYLDFPILLETWRTCLQDEMDLPALFDLLDEVANGTIAQSEVTTEKPSPFASEVIWKRTNEAMYSGDDSGSKKSALREDLIAEVLFSSELRPSIGQKAITTLDGKLKRTHHGYSPRDGEDLLDWILERVLIPEDEWWVLLEATERDHGLSKEVVIEELSDRVVGWGYEGEGGLFVCSVEQVRRVMRLFGQDRNIVFCSAFLDGKAVPRKALQAISKLDESGDEFLLFENDDEGMLASFLGEWLRFYGPIRVKKIMSAFSIDETRLKSALARLKEESRIVVDAITEHAVDVEVCHGENLAHLLRLTRFESRGSFEPIGKEALPLFLALHHRFGSRGDEEVLKDSLERLFGYAAPANLWEEEFLPARMESYRRGWLDSLFAESGLQWLGFKKQKIAFLLEDDRELFAPPRRVGAKEKETLSRIFPGGPGRFSVSDLHLEKEGQRLGDLVGELWSHAWNGLVSNDSFAAVRQGVENGFHTRENNRGGIGRATGGRFSRWKSENSCRGNWFRLPRPGKMEDPLEEEERKRDRVRQLLARYGILFRELLLRELPGFRFGALFRTLRILELSGEVIGGSFFRDIPSLQFISPEALQKLRAGLPEKHIFWMNASDPSSPCGLGWKDLELPRRVPTNHVVFRGHEIVIVSRRRARNLTIRISPSDSDVVEALGFMETLLTRDVRPMRAIVIEEINGQSAAASPFYEPLTARFNVDRDRKFLHVTRRY